MAVLLTVLDVLIRSASKEVLQKYLGVDVMNMTLKSLTPVAAMLALSIGTTTAMVSDVHAAPTKVADSEGRCGEGKCGAEGKKAGAEGKCGEGKCGAADKKASAEGKCGEGKCGAAGKKSGTEGKCGEGKCGGSR
ncbi:MAG: hypothetical protein U0989_09755 [Azonexus sp.]|jgi:uncharacterized low-complexity protein|nr:hypothetical protein [Azonexus sp.]